MSKDEIFVTCACYGEGVWMVFDAEDDWFYVSLWDSHLHPPSSKMPWRVRLRHIWQIIRQGTPYSDDVILRYEEAQALAQWLSTRKAGLRGKRRAPEPLR